MNQNAFLLPLTENKFPFNQVYSEKRFFNAEDLLFLTVQGLEEGVTRPVVITLVSKECLIM